LQRPQPPPQPVVNRRPIESVGRIVPLNDRDQPPGGIPLERLRFAAGIYPTTLACQFKLKTAFQTTKYTKYTKRKWVAPVA